MKFVTVPVRPVFITGRPKAILSLQFHLFYVRCCSIFKDGLPYLFYSFRNKYFNKISLGYMLYYQNKL